MFFVFFPVVCFVLFCFCLLGTLVPVSLFYSHRSAVFSAQEACNVHHTSPSYTQLKMHTYHSISYVWFISGKRRNKLQHILNGNIDRAEMKAFCDKLKFNDILDLIPLLQEKFPNPTKWSTRANNSKTVKWLTTVSKFTDLVSGGESTELMTRYLSTRPTLKQQLSRNLVNEDNARKLTTLKNNYLVVMPFGCVWVRMKSQHIVN